LNGWIERMAGVVMGLKSGLFRWHFYSKGQLALGLCIEFEL
jgi:hypothetical protein